MTKYAVGEDRYLDGSIVPITVFTTKRDVVVKMAKTLQLRFAQREKTHISVMGYHGSFTTVPEKYVVLVRE
jgi:hypothetical protein